MPEARTVPRNSTSNPWQIEIVVCSCCFSVVSGLGSRSRVGAGVVRSSFTVVFTAESASEISGLDDVSRTGAGVVNDMSTFLPVQQVAVSASVLIAREC